MKKKIVVKMMVGVLFLLTLIISSTYAYFNIVSTTNRNTTSNYNAKLEDIEKYGTSLLTGGEGELHLRVKASDMTPSKIGNKYYATTSEEDYQLRRGNHIVSKATIQKGLSNYEYNCTSKLTITLDGTMVTEDGLQVGDAKLYLRGTNNNIKNEEYDLKTLIDELELNSEGKKEYTREIEYLLTSDNEGKVMIDVEFANNSNNQTTSSGKNLNIEITNSELVCGLGNSKVYASLDTSINNGYGEKYLAKEYREKIITTSFVNYKPSEEELLTKSMYWDLTNTSKSEAGSVIGWLEEREETNTYDLYIGSDKEIYATTLNSAFYQMKNLQEIKFDNINTSETTSMSYMFYNCNNLVELDLSNFDTSQVTDMRYMFYNCNNLVELDLSNFDTSSVKIMSYMFGAGISSQFIAKIIFPKEFGSSATDMKYMFQNSKITDLDLSNFDTSNVTNMSGMFDGFEGTTLDVTHFDTSSVTEMKYMFARCINLNTLDISSFDTSSVKIMSYMFSSVSFNAGSNNGLIAKIIFPKEFGSSATDMSYMFYNYQGIDLDLSNFDTSSVINMERMFYKCINLKTLDLSHFDTSSVTNMSEMFREISVDLPFKNWENFTTANVENMSGMFAGYKKTVLDISTFNTSKVNNMSEMFGTNLSGGYSNIVKIIGINDIDTSQVKNMSYMFDNLKQLTELDISNFDTTNVINMSSMFNDCINLKDLKLNKAIFDGLTTTNSYNRMFGYLATGNRGGDYRVPNDIHLTIKKGQETFINDRLNDAYPEGHNATIDFVD